MACTCVANNNVLYEHAKCHYVNGNVAYFTDKSLHISCITLGCNIKQGIFYLSGVFTYTCDCI